LGLAARSLASAAISSVLFDPAFHHIEGTQLIQLHKSLHFSPLSAILIASGRCTLGLSPPSGRATGKGTLA
jgi:hypothetical protein